ncbi:HugZ family protein [Neorhizobium sp. P12A]|uniref:HugZ family pyridoxamine 5'-phosphate oxidase n=1 Tax=Neorhizobium sp. P12A TaxID=2268027 RepID=UPI0011EF1AD4|nr:pyridoxamine 5'-phosphate oxidase family protein [Neorhizobium sp. P12A]KAA0701226.1 HugZ family protein [Neorhizobium sp. P12A]
MNDRPSVLRETDEEARRLARILLRSTQHAPLAVIEPDSGFPSVSRTLVGTDIDGVPVILVSALSAHTKALLADPRASLLAGEPGKGDPLAHPRLSVQCQAEKVNHDSALHARLRGRFLARHPKSALYIDFRDFCFFRLVPLAVSLNGGFGKAYILPGEDLLIRSEANEAIAADGDIIVRELLEQHPLIVRGITERLNQKSHRNGRICGLDAAGLDLFWGENMLRYEFDSQLELYNGPNSYISKIEYSIP